MKRKLRRVLTALAAFVLIPGAYFTLIDTPVAAQRATEAQGQPSSGSFLAGQILVQFQPGTPTAVQAAIHRAQGATVRRVIRGIDVRVVAVPRGTEQAKVAAYARNPNVLYAEPDYLHQPLNGPNDPGFVLGLKWDLHNEGQFGATPDADIDWHEAYQALAGTPLQGVTIAVVDTGADLEHPDLMGNLISGWDFVGDDGSSPDDDPGDEYGHGTHTAGIAAAVTDNDEGTASVAFSASILPLRVCVPEGCPVSATSEAYIWAVDFGGAKVINISLGGLSRSRTEASAVKYAWNNGAVLAASAGNLGNTLNGAQWKHYPAAYSQVMAVSATNWHDVLAYYSSHGNWLSVTAPGGEMAALHDQGGIYSTMPTYEVTLNGFGYFRGYDQLQGTSMSAPQVAGLAALLFAVDGTLTNSDVRSIIETSADDLGASGFDALYGNGRINAHAAVLAALGPATGNTPPTVTITEPTNGTSVTEGTSVTFSGTAEDAEDGPLTASLVWTSSLNGPIGIPGGSVTTSTLSAGTHTITAAVSDSGGLSDSKSITVTVNAIGGDPITLIASGYKVKGRQKADLSWSPSGTTLSVYVYRDGTFVTTPNDGFYTDNIDQRGGGSYTYQVCEAGGTGICSNEATVVF